MVDSCAPGRGRNVAGVASGEPDSGFGRMRAWVLAHASAAKRVMGGLLLLVGLLILTGGDHATEAWVDDRVPDTWLALTTPALTTS
jgi:hypothetical protein